jgi:hypothetical protein
VVEGESPYRAAPGAQGDSDEEDVEDDDDSLGAPTGTVYRVVRSQLKKLDGGMAQYEEIAARTAAKLAARR